LKDGSHGEAPIPQCRLQASGVSGVPVHGLAKRHDISRNRIRVWVDNYEAGAFDDATPWQQAAMGTPEDARAADLMQAY
jgi:transposase